ncbi:MAG: hypothetical protein B6U94_08780 [Thermofilum sp. ex4484_79]|nr:MAG: hypothetical protein B6U94_08780 [Thermofilum sp. ex4484_79]
MGRKIKFSAPMLGDTSADDILSILTKYGPTIRLLISLIILSTSSSIRMNTGITKKKHIKPNVEIRE